MTKVQLQYALLRPADDSTMNAIARAHGVYGLIRVSLSPSMDQILVEYDASRLSAREVEAKLHSMGLAVAVHV